MSAAAFSFGAAFTIAVILTPLLRRFAHRIGYLDRPGANSSHAAPVPRSATPYSVPSGAKSMPETITLLNIGPPTSVLAAVDRFTVYRSERVDGLDTALAT